MLQPQRCSVPNCARLAAASLQTRLFCRGHFVSTCYEQLDFYAWSLSKRPFSRAVAESARQFLADCTRQASALGETEAYLGNQERNRIADILRWADDLGRRLRRSPRKVVTLPIRMRFDSARPWEEETHTRMLSRHGALVECRHPAEAGETLHVLRLDIHREGQARVAWLRQKGPNRVEMGIEFVNCDNFWGLDWGTNQSAP